MATTVISRCAVILVLLAGLSARADDDTIANLRKIYETSLERIEADVAARRSDVSEDYTTNLMLLGRRAQNAGSLELLLAASTEQERFLKDKTISRTGDESAHPSIAQLKKNYFSGLDDSERERSAAVIQLTERYRSHLEMRIKQLTMDGKISEAMAMNNEKDLVESGAAYKAALLSDADDAAMLAPQPVAGEAPQPPTKQKQVLSDDGFSIVWDRRNVHRGVRVSQGGSSRDVEVVHEGGNSTKSDHIACRGGRTLLGSASDDLLSACKRSNALTINVSLETRDLAQTGPARIISFSQSGYSRNVSLCQEKDQLILRLRTTKTGPNGASPEVALSSIVKGDPSHVLLTYRPGELRVYVNGEEVNVKQIEGDFSNWEPQQLVLGNEWKDDRPWVGHIYTFSISNEFTDKANALALTRR